MSSGFSRSSTPSRCSNAPLTPRPIFTPRCASAKSRPRLRLPQPRLRLRRRQIGRAGKGGVNQAIELGIVERTPPLRRNRRLRAGGQTERFGGFHGGGGVLGMSGAARKQCGTEEK